MANTYSIGTVVRSAVIFTDLAGVSGDPTTISLSYKDPTNTTTVVTYAGGQVVKDSTGHYHYDITATYAGIYQMRWVGAGSLAASDQSYFVVQPDNT